MTKVLQIQKITISPESIAAALKDLDRAIARHEEMKRLLVQLLETQEGKAGAGRGRAGRVGGRGRRPKGELTLAAAMVKVLNRAGKPVKPIDMQKKVVQAGYKTSATSRSLYTALFNTARREGAITHTPDGFALSNGRKTRGGTSAKRRAKKKAAKKTRRKATTKKKA